MSTLIFSITSEEIIEIAPVEGFIQIVPIHGELGYLIGLSGVSPLTSDEFVSIPNEYEEKSFEMLGTESLFLKGNGRYAINVGTKI